MQVDAYETGNEHRQHEPIIPDLKARPHHHGGDHPTPFTKGCNDATSIHRTGDTDATPPQTEEEDVVAEGDFEPAEAFTGVRDGFAFKMGSRGLGYYRIK
jgi:hypothetical protein